MAVMSGIFGPTWGGTTRTSRPTGADRPRMSGTWRASTPGVAGRGSVPSRSRRRSRPRWAAAPLATTAASYMDMLNKQQQGVLSKMLEESQKQRQGTCLWLASGPRSGLLPTCGGRPTRRTVTPQRRQSMARGWAARSGQWQGCGRRRRRSRGSSSQGETALPTAEAATAQGGLGGRRETGEMMGQVSTAWGGTARRAGVHQLYDRQNQMQRARGVAGHKDIRLEFAKLAMDNPKTAQEMYLADQENRQRSALLVLAQRKPAHQHHDAAGEAPAGVVHGACKRGRCCTTSDRRGVQVAEAGARPAAEHDRPARTRTPRPLALARA